MLEKGKALRQENREDGFLSGSWELRAHSLAEASPSTRVKKEAG